MSDRTGIARGTLQPVIYFERASDNYVILPGFDPGRIDQARWVYESKYKDGWRWCEAGTLAEVDRLQKRLARQEEERISKMVEVDSVMRQRCYEISGSRLRQQMVSASTTPFERDFIAAYLQLRDEKRDKYRDTLEHHNYYLMARECDSGKKVEDMLPLQEGQFERRGV